ncbi:MAG: SPOR domain-containing protein [Comamonadaceae bacterium]|nr:SPOR domain-containing protein [Comamonadaceae bacterium]
MLIMQDAQGNYAISLGLFVQPDNARARIEELKQKGVEARQEVRERAESVVWFDLQLPEPADAAVTRLRGLDWGAGVELRDAECPAEPTR